MGRLELAYFSLLFGFERFAGVSSLLSFARDKLDGCFGTVGGSHDAVRTGDRVMLVILFNCIFDSNIIRGGKGKNMVL